MQKINKIYVYGNKKMLKKIIMLASLLCLSACTATITEDKFITQSDELDTFTKEDISRWQQDFPAHQLKDISFLSKDKSARLTGLYLDNKESDDVIFLIQGNGMQVNLGGIEMLQSLSGLNKDLVIFDRRGLGASSGQANISNLISDANEAYDFIKREITPNKVIVHGHSLGSFIAAQLAAKKSIDALVLQGSATNVDEWVDSKMPWYTWPFLTVNIDPAFAVADNKVIVAQTYLKPLLVIAAEDDEMVPPELSEQLYDVSQSKIKTLIMVKGSGHSNMFDHPSTLDGYLKFLQLI